MPDGAFKLCIGPRPRAGLFVRRDIRAYESLGREDPVVKLSLESLTHTFSSRQRQAARVGIILFAMAHEAMRCSLHQVTPALQVFWRRLSSKLFATFPESSALVLLKTITICKTTASTRRETDTQTRSHRDLGPWSTSVFVRDHPPRGIAASIHRNDLRGGMFFLLCFFASLLRCYLLLASPPQGDRPVHRMRHGEAAFARFQESLLQREIPLRGPVGVVNEHELWIVLQSFRLPDHGLLVLP